ncbi:MAG: hypothetical protein WCK98_03140 [bacterium]
MPTESLNTLELKKQLDQLKGDVESKAPTEKLFRLEQFDMLVKKVQDTKQENADWSEIRDRVLKLIALHDGNPQTDSADDFKVSSKEQVLRLLQQLRGLIYEQKTGAIDHKLQTPEHQELQKVLKGFELIKGMFKSGEPYFVIYNLGNGSFNVSANPRINNFQLASKQHSPVPKDFVAQGYVNTIAKFLENPENLKKYSLELQPYMQFIQTRNVLDNQTSKIFPGLEMINSSPELRNLAQRINQNSVVVKSNFDLDGKEYFLHAAGSGVDANALNSEIPQGKVLITNNHVVVDHDKLEYVFANGQTAIINKPIILNFKNGEVFYDFKIAIDPDYANKLGIENIIQKIIKSNLFPKTQQMADSIGQSNLNGVLFTAYNQSTHDINSSGANTTPFKTFPNSPIGSDIKGSSSPSEYSAGNYTALYPTLPITTSEIITTGRRPETSFGGNSGSGIVILDNKNTPYFGLLNGGRNYSFRERPLGEINSEVGENYKLLYPGSIAPRAEKDAKNDPGTEKDEKGEKDDLRTPKVPVLVDFGNPEQAGIARSTAPITMIPKAMGINIVHIPESALLSFQIEEPEVLEQGDIQDTNKRTIPKTQNNIPIQPGNNSIETEISRQISKSYIKALLEEFSAEKKPLSPNDSNTKSSLFFPIFNRLYKEVYKYPSDVHSPLDTLNNSILNRHTQNQVNQNIAELILSPNQEIINTIRTAIIPKLFLPESDLFKKNINEFLSAHSPEVKTQFRQEIINQGNKRGISEAIIEQMINDINPYKEANINQIIKLGFQPILRK